MFRWCHKGEGLRTWSVFIHFQCSIAALTWQVSTYCKSTEKKHEINQHLGVQIKYCWCSPSSSFSLQDLRQQLLLSPFRHIQISSCTALRSSHDTCQMSSCSWSKVVGTKVLCTWATFMTTTWGPSRGIWCSHPITSDHLITWSADLTWSLSLCPCGCLSLCRERPPRCAACVWSEERTCVCGGPCQWIGPDWRQL